MAIHMPMWAPLITDCVYEYNDQLLEANWNDNTWLLVLLDEEANYLAPAQGRLFAFELRDDGLWDSCHYVQIAAIWPSFHYLKGAAIAIDADKLEVVAASRFELQVQWAFEDEEFYEMMSDFSFERESE